MALTRTVTHGANISTAVATTAVTHTITATSLVVCIFQAPDNIVHVSDAATPMTVSGTAMSWTKVAEVTPATGSTKSITRMYAAISNGAGSRTFTHTRANTTTFDRRLSVYAFEGALTTVATAIPSGNRFANSTPAANSSQSITPAGAGSMILGAIGDWNQTNTYATLSNNTLSNPSNIAGQYTATMVEPTTNPLASGAAFTWGANTTGGSCTYCVIEIVPAGGAAATSLPPFGMQRKFFTRRINR